MNEVSVGDRIRLSSGYDGEASAWLAGGSGYDATVIAIEGVTAAVRFDTPVRLSGGDWQDFGNGAPQALRNVNEIEAHYAVLILTWVGARWVSPVEPIHVGLSETEPTLSSIPTGGGAGVWVESHATATTISATPPESQPSPTTRVEEPPRKKRSPWWKRS